MKILLLLPSVLLLNFYHNAVAANCTPTKTYIPLPSEMGEAEYMRVHPSGEFALATVSSGNPSQVVLLDLRNKNLKGEIQPVLIPTPLNAEAYPLEPDWELVSSPNHDNGMRYFRFSDLISLKKLAEPVFNDPDHNQFYHSVAKISESDSEIKFRTALWKDTRSKSYIATKSKDGEVLSVVGDENSEAAMCGPTTTLNETQKTAIRKKLNDLAKKIENIEIGQDPSSFRMSFYKAINGFSLTNSSIEAVMSGLSEPILSKDGQEVAGLNTDGKLTIFSFDGTSCKPVDSIGVQTSKVSFSYPAKDKKGRLAFTSDGPVKEGQSFSWEKVVSIYDRDSGKLAAISEPFEHSPSYPGFTKNGRLIYRAEVSGDRPSGVPEGQMLVISDPNIPSGQEPLGTCINQVGPVDNGISVRPETGSQ